MKKLILLALLATSLCQAQFVKKEYTQLSAWVDPVATVKESGPQLGVDIQKIMRWGWVSASVSHFGKLEPSYTDFVASGGINFNLFNFEPLRYYTGPRLGFMFRGGHGYPLAGGVIGADWTISKPNTSTKIAIGARAWIDYREDQKQQFYGDYSAYERGLITNNALLQENGAIVLSIIF